MAVHQSLGSGYRGRAEHGEAVAETQIDPGELLVADRDGCTPEGDRGRYAIYAGGDRRIRTGAGMIDRYAVTPDPKIVGLASNGFGRKLLIGVYFIREVGGDAVKIGFSSIDPRQRLADLQRGNPRDLEVFAFQPGGTRETERAWHRRYAANRLAGEWFRLNASMQAEIDAVAVQADRLVEYMSHIIANDAGLRVLRQWMSETGTTAEAIAEACGYPVARIARLVEGMNRRGISLNVARKIHQMANGAFSLDDIRPGTAARLASNERLRAERKLRAAQNRLALLTKEAA